ncbi:MAG: PepSY domain-containing protein [Myxococcales bacterium]|nr:PepSY domain-containing protein [Myxococcales bacterium]
MRRRRWRGWWALHRRVGVGVALFVLVVTSSGILLLFRDQLREPIPKATPTTATISLDAVVASAVAHGGAPATDVTMPAAPDEPYRVWIDDDDETLVFVDGRGEVLGARATRTGLTRLLFALHTGELLGGLGWALALATGLSMLTLALSGAVMASARWGRRRRRRGPA